MKFSTIFPILAYATAAVSARGTGGKVTSSTTTSTSGATSPSNSVAAAPNTAGTTIATYVPAYGPFTGNPTRLTSTPTLPAGPRQSSTNQTAAQYAAAHPYCQNGPNSRGCWGRYSINTDYETSWPNTGRVVKYNLEITNMTLSPDGTPKQMLVINGQYPGPLITCNWGDILQITVKNSLASNGTSMHWHGIRQLNSNPQDGVNGITECPLAPGDTKVYRFQATQYGTTWYHSHFSAQYGDGVVGPIIIQGPASANYDIDLGAVQVSDTYSLTVFQEDWYAEHFGPPTASNYLINGQNIKVDGSAGTRAKFTFTPGKKHLIRIINTSVDNHFKVTLDGHNMTVISTDFVPINPYTTNIVNVNIGQRYEVVIEANQPVSSYYLRAIVQQSCSRNSNTGLGNANAIVQYTGSTATLPNSTVTSYTDACEDEPAASLVPVVSKTVDSTAFAASASELPVNIAVVQTANDRVFKWTLNQVSQDIDWANPTIAQVVAGNDSFPTVRDVITLSTANTWTYWVIQNQFFVPHPMHLHGHDFSLLGQGAGIFDATANFGQLNFNNPPRRDVAILLASGWTVIAFKTDNPGAWLMHCHIAWHVGEGLSLQFLELPSQVASEFSSTVKSTAFQNTCNNWNAYTNSTADIYAKTDSGLKKRGDEVNFARRHLNSHRFNRHARRVEDFTPTRQGWTTDVVVGGWLTGQ